MKYLPLLRKICQLSILALFCALPFFAALGFEGLGGTLFSFDLFGIPFADPASTMQVLGQGALEAVFPKYTVLLGAALSLILAFFLGRVFCGWICPYGFFSELAGKRKKPWKYAERMKILVFIGALLLACLLGYPLVSILSMPGQISLSPALWRDDPGMTILLLVPPFLALLLDLLLGRRFFCSHICPQSLFLGAAAALLPKKLPGMHIDWKKEKCICKDAPCEKACQFFLKPRKNLPRKSCTMCGDCVAICAKKGSALSFSLHTANDNKQ